MNFRTEYPRAGPITVSKVLPMIKDDAYARSIRTVPIRPMWGVYSISAVPTMRPPPTHVATQHTVHSKSWKGPAAATEHEDEVPAGSSHDDTRGLNKPILKT